MKTINAAKKVMIHGVCEGVASGLMLLFAEGLLPTPESIKGMDPEAATLYVGVSLYKAAIFAVDRLEDFAERNPVDKR